jgi:hypothetical protein
MYIYASHQINERLIPSPTPPTQSKATVLPPRPSSSSDINPFALPDRRTLLVATISLASSLSLSTPPSQAIQGSIAGRIPGITGPDADGYYLYQRPEGKSGGHGIGWSELPRYSFKVPVGWEETPVSIADLGGTEIDLRYAQEDQGSLMVVVAPVLRFMEVGYNADITIDEVGPPERLIEGFAPELFGAPLKEGDVLDTKVVQKNGRAYYEWSLKPHRLVAATAVGNRVFLLAVSANSRQWRKSEDVLETIQGSFKVPPKQQA